MVDDDQSIRDMVRAILENMGFKKIETAHHGSAALKAVNAAADNFDFIICDWVMPKLDGLGVLKELRSRKYETRFVMLPQKKNAGDISEAIKAGLDAYVAKPFEPIQLQKRIESLI